MHKNAKLTEYVWPFCQVDSDKGLVDRWVIDHHWPFSSFNHYATIIASSSKHVMLIVEPITICSWSVAAHLGFTGAGRSPWFTTRISWGFYDVWYAVHPSFLVNGKNFQVQHLSPKSLKGYLFRCLNLSAIHMKFQQPLSMGKSFTMSGCSPSHQFH